MRKLDRSGLRDRIVASRWPLTPIT
jgi:hypothetical protein